MNKPSHHESFEYRESAHIKSLDIHVNEFRHKVTGTPHFHLATYNTENAFWSACALSLPIPQVSPTSLSTPFYVAVNDTPCETPFL